MVRRAEVGVLAAGAIFLFVLVLLAWKYKSEWRVTGGPILVNEKIPGKVWFSTDVAGEAEMMRITGEVKVFPVFRAWVRYDLGKIEIGAQALSNDPRPLPWWFPHFAVEHEFKDGVTTIRDDVTHSDGETQRMARIHISRGRPSHVVFTQWDFYNSGDVRDISFTANFQEE